MKLLATTAAVSLFAFAAHAETFLGCEVKPIEGTNAYQLVDATCTFAFAPNDDGPIDEDPEDPNAVVKNPWWES